MRFDNIPLLADRLFKYVSAEPKKALIQVRDNGKAVADFRQFMKDAQRFALDDEMAAMLGDLGWAFFDRYKPHINTWGRSPEGDKEHARVDRLLNDTRILSRLPFDNTWVEYNFRKRFAAQKNNNPALFTPLDQVSSVVGYIMRKLPQSDTMFSATLVLDDEGIQTTVGGPIISPWAYVWSTSEDDELPPGVPWMTPEQQARISVGFASSGEWTKYVRLVETWPLTGSLANLSDYDRSRYIEEFGGELRYIWSLLATINDLPTRSEVVQPQRGYMCRGQIRKFFSYSIIHLHVPKDTTRTQLAKKVVVRTRQKAHRVRGHWRTNWRDVNGPKIWVREHVAGDASLGWVYHDYSVEKG
jgi:hypothetical protein